MIDNSIEDLKSQDEIWCVYNHFPGGNICFTHFETYSRKRKRASGSDTESLEEVVFTAWHNYENWLFSDYVCLFQNGVLEKNKALIYTGGGMAKMKKNPNFGKDIIEWAKSKGVQEYESPNEKKPTDLEEKSKAMDLRITGVESSVSALAKALDTQNRLLEMLIQNQSQKEPTHGSGKKDGDSKDSD